MPVGSAPGIKELKGLYNIGVNVWIKPPTKTSIEALVIEPLIVEPLVVKTLIGVKSLVGVKALVEALIGVEPSLETHK